MGNSKARWPFWLFFISKMDTDWRALSKIGCPLYSGTQGHLTHKHINDAPCTSSSMHADVTTVLNGFPLEELKRLHKLGTHWYSYKNTVCCVVCEMCMLGRAFNSTASGSERTCPWGKKLGPFDPIHLLACGTAVIKHWPESFYNFQHNSSDTCFSKQPPVETSMLIFLIT